MEQMFDLFKEQQIVKDITGAPELKVTEGTVVFGEYTECSDSTMRCSLQINELTC
jgi:hypothetical protein